MLTYCKIPRKGLQALFVRNIFVTFVKNTVKYGSVYQSQLSECILVKNAIVKGTHGVCEKRLAYAAAPAS